MISYSYATYYIYQKRTPKDYLVITNIGKVGVFFFRVCPPPTSGGLKKSETSSLSFLFMSAITRKKFNPFLIQKHSPGFILCVGYYKL